MRKVLRSEKARFEYCRENVPRPVLGAFVEVLSSWLEADKALLVKQRRTAQRLYEALLGEGYRGGYDSVGCFVKVWRRDHQCTPTDAYIPLCFDPGE